MINSLTEEQQEVIKRFSQIKRNTKTDSSYALTVKAKGLTILFFVLYDMDDYYPSTKEFGYCRFDTSIAQFASKDLEYWINELSECDSDCFSDLIFSAAFEKAKKIPKFDLIKSEFRDIRQWAEKNKGYMTLIDQYIQTSKTEKDLINHLLGQKASTEEEKNYTSYHAQPETTEAT